MDTLFQIGDIIEYDSCHSLIVDIYPTGHKKNPYAFRTAYVLLNLDKQTNYPNIWSAKVIEKHYRKVA